MQYLLVPRVDLFFSILYIVGGVSWAGVVYFFSSLRERIQLSEMAATTQQQLADTYINEASKLNGENYVNWKFKLQTVLELFGGWTIVNGTELKPVDPALIPDWKKGKPKPR